MNTDDKKALDNLLKRFSPQAIRRRWQALDHAQRAQKRVLFDLFMLREETALSHLEMLCAELPDSERRRLREQISTALREAAEDSPFKKVFAKLAKLVNGQGIHVG